MKKIYIKIVFIISMLLSSNIYALELNTLKEKKHVGENNSGYLVSLVKNKEVIEYVKEINEKRNLLYIKSAKKLNISLEIFEKRIADKIESESKQGYVVENEFGEWVSSSTLNF